MTILARYRHLLHAALSFALFSILSGAVYASVLVMQAVADLTEELPKTDQLSRDTLSEATQIYDRNGHKIGEIGSRRRYFVALKELPPHVSGAFLAAEDKNFYRHPGIDLGAIARSLYANIKGQAIKQGASTITQQLARMSFLSSARTLDRKIKEIILALAIEQRLTKSDILELYLNKVYLGHHSFGIEAAARNYFRKSARDLSVGEAALLAGLPKAPSRLLPTRFPQRASKRQAFVLRRMAEDGIISKKAARHWTKLPLKVSAIPEPVDQGAPYFVNAVAAELERKLVLSGLPSRGLIVHTTLDMALENTALATLREAATDLKHRLGRNPHGKADSYQGALVSIDPHTGAVLAMHGGVSYAESQFNRAVHAKRRLSLAFAPVLLSLALDKGYTLTSKILGDGDHPRAQFHLESDSLYTTFVEGRVLDLAPLYAAVGGGTLAQHTRKFGFAVDRDDITLALGYGEASSLELARAYASFVNGGQLIHPYLITKVKSRDGRVLFQATPGQQLREPLLDRSHAFVLHRLLEDRLLSEFAKLGVQGPKRAFGTTAVTDDLHDTWFAGGDQQLVTALWLGAEVGRLRLGATVDEAAAAPLKAWHRYLKQAPKRYRTPSQRPTPPAAISYVKLPQGALPFVLGTEPSAAKGQGGDALSSESGSAPSPTGRAPTVKKFAKGLSSGRPKAGTM